MIQRQLLALKMTFTFAINELFALPPFLLRGDSEEVEEDEITEDNELADDEDLEDDDLLDDDKEEV